jgi:hypothetical protein
VIATASYFEAQLACMERPLAHKGGRDFWRKDPVVFDDAGNVTRGGFNAKQLEWWNLEQFVKLFVAGYGGGKTNILCKRVISSALTNAPASVALVSPTYTMAMDTTVSTTAEMLAGKQTLYGKEFRWRYNGNRHEFVIRFRGRVARIRVYSGDNPTRLKGANLAAAYIDEPFIQDEEVLTQMVARVRHPQAKLLEIGLAGTPEQLNWGHKLATGKLGAQLSVGVVRASTTDNPVLHKDYVARLRQKLDPLAQRAFIDGEFVNLSTGRVYYAFDEEVNIRRLPLPTNVELGAGMDFNVDPMTSAVFWTNGKHVHYFAELELPNSDTEYACSALREVYWDKGLRKIYPDASGAQRSTSGGRSDYAIIKRMGFQVKANSVNPMRRDRFNAVNAKLANGTLTIDPSCEKLLEYLRTLTHENTNKKTGKRATHLTDAFSYPVAYLFPTDRSALSVARVVGY